MLIWSIDINSWYNPNTFIKAIQYANEYRDIAGVEKIIGMLQSCYEGYKNDMTALINREQPQIDNRLDAGRLAEKRANLSKWTSIICFISVFVSMFFCGIFHSPWSGLIILLVDFILLLIGIVGVILMVIYKIKLTRIEKDYDSYVNSIQIEKKRIEAKYINNVQPLCDNVDVLYLNSLEPAHREAVLMRREQKRYHQEMLDMQRNQQYKQMEHQKMVEEEQKRIRKAQEELLRIEQERENRYNRYK